MFIRFQDKVFFVNLCDGTLFFFFNVFFSSKIESFLLLYVPMYFFYVYRYLKFDSLLFIFLLVVVLLHLYFLLLNIGFDLFLSSTGWPCVCCPVLPNTASFTFASS